MMTSYRTSSIFLLVLCCLSVNILTATAAEPTKPQIKNLQEVINSQHYPQKLKDNPIEGKVIVSIWLDAEGEILKYKVDEANNEDLKAFVQGRVPLLEFEPARDEFGARTYSKVRLPFEFKMEE
ncbi:MAG: TonB family protein [Bacteroidota bacterium]